LPSIFGENGIWAWPQSKIWSPYWRSMESGLFLYRPPIPSMPVPFGLLGSLGSLREKVCRVIGCDLIMAHELGHLILKTPEEGDKRRREKPTMRFAGAFLVPAEVVKKELGNNRSQIKLEELHLLKHKYGLSMSAWVYRAKDLGIFSPALIQRFYMIFHREGWSEKEPGNPYPPEPSPTRLKQLVYRAFGEEIISETKAAELLGQSLAKFRQELLNQNA